MFCQECHAVIHGDCLAEAPLGRFGVPGCREETGVEPAAVSAFRRQGGCLSAIHELAFGLGACER